jgi:hypothetical protein
VKLPIKQPASLRRLPKRRNSQKRRSHLIFLLSVAVIQATGSIVRRITTTIEATNAIATTNDLIIIIKKIDAMITLVTKTRTTRTKSPRRRRMIASAITSRKRAARPCIITSPLHRVQTPPLEKGVAHVQDLLLALIPILTLA